MNNAVLLLSTILTLATAPHGSDRGPASSEPPTRMPMLEDPCEGRGRVTNVPSPYDDLDHTCTCVLVRDIHGRPIRVDVRCW